MSEFSAQYYLDMSEEEFRKEAADHGIEMYGRPRTNDIVDAVYNAELQRRHDAARKQQESESQSASKPESQPEGYDAMTVAELRDLAEQRGVDLEGATRKADIIEALESDDEANG